MTTSRRDSREGRVEGPSSGLGGNPAAGLGRQRSGRAADCGDGCRHGPGPAPRAEEFLARLPDLSDHDAVRIIYEEASLRLERGESSVTAEFVRRFPRWRSELGLLIECKQLLIAGMRVDFPEVGEDLEDFRLLAELGRGAVGRTFLARQQSLAGRLVVLKVTPLDHEEHLSLAGLQHMHIVPLYFEQVLPERLIRVMGMPYLGGSTLARIFDELRAVPDDQRTGKRILDAIDHHAVPFPSGSLATDRTGSTSRRHPSSRRSAGSRPAWPTRFSTRHDRGLVHLDVKPSNVLIAGDGQPMLLDFHLAQGPLLPGHCSPDRLGGTLGYLSPEQKAAMDSVRNGEEVCVAVDGRSDIYSLGSLLSEAFAADPGTGGAAKRPGARWSPQVSPGLTDILRKCLAHDPADRYQEAASLALDLRRHLNDLPLRGVVNRSPIERWRKWRRRSPGALHRHLVRLGLGLTFLAVIAISIVHFRQRDRQIDAALEEARADLGKGLYPEAAVVLQRGLELAGYLPAGDRRKQALITSLQRALRAKTAAELHDAVNLLRFRFGIIPPEPHEAESLFLRGLEIWKSRDRITSPGGLPADPATQRQIRTDLIDLAMILAGLCTHRGSGLDAHVALGDAFQILLDAETQFGPSPALSRDLRNRARALGRDGLPPISIPQPRTAWEHYDLGRSYLGSGEFALAETEFRRSIALRPEEFWPYYYHGISTYRLGRYQDAVAALTTSIALAPRTAECYYNRALAYQALGQDEKATRRRLPRCELNPRFTNAALNRGTILFRAGEHEHALADFERRRATASGPKLLGLIHYNEALVHMARKDLTAARSSMRQALAQGNDDAQRLRERLGP